MMRLQNYKLGKKAPRYDARTLKLSDYLSKALANPPSNAGHVTDVKDWPMMLNDSLGDCTCAAAGHMIEQWTTYAGDPTIPSDKLILDAYEAVSGYNPNNPASDQGAVILDVLNYWRKTGIARHKIAAYVAVNPKNHNEVKQAVQLFGNCYIGVGLPVTAQNPVQGTNGNPCWSLPSMGLTGNGAFGSWGGHAIPIVGYGIDVEGNQGCEVITWGQVYDMTWGFLDAFCDEAYAVLSPDWIDAQGTAPSGFNLSQLQSDLAQITAEGVM